MERMKIITLASTNPVKAAAALEGFTRMFPHEMFSIQQVSTTLALPSQPSTDEVTLDCATKRAANIRELAPESDYWVGIEGGIADWSIGMGAFAWVVVLDRTGRMGRGRTGEFFLPESVAALVRQGMELGEADDRIFSRNNSKQGSGAVGLLTRDVIDRAGLYVPAVVFALIPFCNPELYP
jgi:inosine/xanthosine triphosphatase